MNIVGMAAFEEVELDSGKKWKVFLLPDGEYEPSLMYRDFPFVEFSNQIDALQKLKDEYPYYTLIPLSRFFREVTRREEIRRGQFVFMG